MGLLPADLKAELQSESPNAFYYLEVDWSDGTKRYSKAGVNSASLGPMASTVIQFGKLGQRIAPLQTTLSAITLDVTVWDQAFEFSNRLGTGQTVLNVAGRVYIASPNAAAAFQVFGGVLTAWSMGGLNRWAWHFQTPDVRLATIFPRYQINRFDFPNIDKGAIGTHRANRKTQATVTLGNYTPIIYGKHDDYGDQSAGAVPCALVDSVGFRHLVSIGIVRVLRVYSDGLLLSSGYSITNPIINGRQYTLVDFTGTHNTQIITADVEGYDTVGDLTGDMIADPMGVIQHIVSNFVLNDYARGPWLATDATFWDTTTVAATKVLLQNRAGGAAYACAKYISNQMSGLQAVNDLCSSMGLLPYWTDAGKLAIKLDNPNVVYPNTYVDDPFVRWEQMKNFTIGYAGQQANRVIVTFENIASGGTGTSTSNTVPKEYYQVEVDDPRSAALRDEHLSTGWSPSTYP